MSQEPPSSSATGGARKRTNKRTNNDARGSEGSRTVGGNVVFQPEFLRKSKERQAAWLRREEAERRAEGERVRERYAADSDRAFKCVIIVWVLIAVGIFGYVFNSIYQSSKYMAAKQGNVY